MSVNQFFRQRGRYLTDSHTYRVMVVIDEDPYWDEGLNFYPKNRKGFKCPKKRILSYQRRMYQTWKHNRKTQWK